MMEKEDETRQTAPKYTRISSEPAKTKVQKKKPYPNVSKNTKLRTKNVEERDGNRLGKIFK